MNMVKLIAGLTLIAGYFFASTCLAETVAGFSQPTALVETTTIEDFQLREGSVAFIPYTGSNPTGAEWVEVSGKTECSPYESAGACRQRAIVTGLINLFNERFPNTQEVSVSTGVADGQTSADRITIKRAILVYPEMDLLDARQVGDGYEVALRTKISAVDPRDFPLVDMGEFETGQGRAGFPRLHGNMTNRNAQRMMSKIGTTLRGVVWTRRHIIDWN